MRNVRRVVLAGAVASLLAVGTGPAFAATPDQASCMGNYAQYMGQASPGAMAAGQQVIIDFANSTGVTPGSLAAGEAQVSGCGLP